jgi:GNAT superfamily N-acetyltransferase
MVRPARAEDVSAIVQLVRELADYERLSQEVALCEGDLRQQLFGTDPAAEVLIAEEQGEVVGFALFFRNFSTFLAKPGLYLEDLFVRPHARGRGHGRALFRAVAKLAVERGCGRFEWAVLDWNQPAIDFYRSFGALPMNEWTVFRLTAEPLLALAQPKANKGARAG